MKRSEVKAKLVAVNKEIETIDDKREDETVSYLTRDKHLPGVGYIHEIETIEDLISAQMNITDLTIVDNSKAIKLLGLTEKEIPKKVSTKILGFAPKVWISDIQTKLSEIREETRYTTLESWKKKLETHSSENDVFSMDTDDIDIDTEDDSSTELGM